MESIPAIISSLSQVGWVVIVGLFLFRFQEPLSKVLDRLTKFRLVLRDGTQVEVTVEQAVGIAQQLLDEVDMSLISDLSEEEKRILRCVADSKSEPTVQELVSKVFNKDFEIDSQEHDLLRSLRERQLLRPAGGSQWRANKRVLKKRFGEILLRIRRDVLLGEKPPVLGRPDIDKQR